MICESKPVKIGALVGGIVGILPIIVVILVVITAVLCTWTFKGRIKKSHTQGNLLEH